MYAKYTELVGYCQWLTMTALRGGRQKFPDIYGYFRKCLVLRPWPWLVVSFPLRLGTRLPHVMSPTSTLGHEEVEEFMEEEVHGGPLAPESPQLAGGY